MDHERRRAPRVRVNLPAKWEGALHQETATITDLSTSGCFVLSGGSVDVKELIWLEIQIPDGPVQYWAEVVDAAYEIGFAVRFNSSSSDDDEARLASYIEGVLATDRARQL
jgi:PilZ domain